MPRLSFFGAAGTVTGSCSLVETSKYRFLVDCGMFQGNRSVRELNFEPFPFDPKTVDFVILTHAHIDHSGLLPKLVKHGFTGKIFATAATGDLLQFMLPDSAMIVESNADRVNRKKQHRSGKTVEPLYRREDADEALRRIDPRDYDTWFSPVTGIYIRFWNAGHILGSASDRNPP